MSQEPWNDEIYNSGEKSRKSRTENGGAATKIFTILAVLFLIIIIAITAIAIYLSNGGSNTDSTQEFYNTSTSKGDAAPASEQVTQPSADQTSQDTTVEQEATSQETTVASSAVEGETITVQAGEGVGSIATRAGISIAELERLNPEKMVGPGGTWWANPGDIVRIK